MPPEAELQWWYQYYFATERGRAGYDTYRREFAKLIWRTASPKWAFDDATFDRSARVLDNPDHVAIVIHNYRWRLGLADGEPNTTSWRDGSPKVPPSRCPPSRSRVTRTVRPSGPECLRGQILGQVFAPDDRGRHRTQPSPGGPGVFARPIVDVDGAT